MIKRDFRLDAVPPVEEGNDPDRKETKEEYDAYFSWLATYLRNVELPVDARLDPDYVEFNGGILERKANSLGYQAFWRTEEEFSAWSEDNYEGYFDPDENGDSIDPLPKDLKQQLLAEDEEENRRFGPDGAPYKDMAWRIPLAMILKRASDVEEATALVSAFYDGYYEDFWK